MNRLTKRLKSSLRTWFPVTKQRRYKDGIIYLSTFCKTLFYDIAIIQGGF